MTVNTGRSRLYKSPHETRCTQSTQWSPSRTTHLVALRPHQLLCVHHGVMLSENAVRVKRCQPVLGSGRIRKDQEEQRETKRQTPRRDVDMVYKECQKIRRSKPRQRSRVYTNERRILRIHVSPLKVTNSHLTRV